MNGNSNNTCIISGCKREVVKHGFCQWHYDVVPGEYQRQLRLLEKNAMPLYGVTVVEVKALIEKAEGKVKKNERKV